MNGNTETPIQKSILEAFQAIPGVYCWRNSTGGFKARGHFFRYGKIGSGDILGWIAPTGRFLTIEVKCPGKKQTDQQREFHANALRDGCVAIVADGVESALTQFAALTHPEEMRDQRRYKEIGNA